MWDVNEQLKHQIYNKKQQNENYKYPKKIKKVGIKLVLVSFNTDAVYETPRKSKTR